MQSAYSSCLQDFQTVDLAAYQLLIAVYLLEIPHSIWSALIIEHFLYVLIYDTPPTTAIQIGHFSFNHFLN